MHGRKKHTMTLINERLIIERLKEGDNQAYKHIYENHYIALCKVSYYFLKDKFLAEGIVNDVILHMWEIRKELSVDIPLRRYLIQAVRNKSLNYLALKQSQMEIQFSIMEQGGVQLQNMVADAQHPLGSLLEKELEHKIKEAIDGLPADCKRVFKMSRFEEMSYEQISKELEISINTVKYHIKNALSILRDKLGPYLCLFLAFYTTLLQNLSVYTI